MINKLQDRLKDLRKNLDKRTKNYRKNLNKRFGNKIDSQKTRRLYFLLLGIIVLTGIGYLLRAYIFAAFVNGKPVFRYEVVQQLEAQGGEEVLSNLITKRLIEDEAREQNAFPTQEEVDAEIEEIRSQLDEQGLTLENALSIQGQTMNDLRENVRLQLAIEKMLGDNMEVTDEEAQNYYDENSELYGEDTEFEDVKDQIKDQLTQERLTMSYQEFISGLQNEANIKRVVNY